MAAAGLVSAGLLVMSASAQGPTLDLPSAFDKAFSGVEACAALRDGAPGAETATSDPMACARRMPPCGTFEIPATVIALDRGVVPDAGAAVRRNPPMEGDPPDGVNLRDAFRRPTPWVYEEIARRIGADAFGRALGAMRYGNAEAGGPVERLGRGEDGPGLTVSAVEQVEFLSRMKRGELPVSAEAQARTVEIIPVERVGDASVAVKSDACDGAAWSVGWVDRGERRVIFSVLEIGGTQEDAAARTRQLLVNLGLLPAPPQPR